MLTGELPLGRFPLPSQKARTDARLDQVVLRALEKEPDRRYQQAGEILTQVETLSAPATAAVRSRKMAVVYQVAMVCALVLIAGLAYALFHNLANPKIITRTVTNSVPRAFARGPNPGFGRGFGPGFDAGFFTNTLEGPSLTPRAATNLQLSPDQVQVVNAIIHTAGQDFSQIHSNYVSHTRDAAGHIHVTVKPLAEADAARVKALRAQMWKELGGVFSPEQLDKARKLPSDPFDGVLPLETNRTEIRELWKDNGGEYHYIDDLESVRGGETIHSNASTNISLIPRAYRSLLD
jgi:hypothetical protein